MCDPSITERKQSLLKEFDLDWMNTIIRSKYMIIWLQYTILYFKVYDAQFTFSRKEQYGPQNDRKFQFKDRLLSVMTVHVTVDPTTAPISMYAVMAKSQNSPVVNPMVKLEMKKIVGITLVVFVKTVSNGPIIETRLPVNGIGSACQMTVAKISRSVKGMKIMSNVHMEQKQCVSIIKSFGVSTIHLKLPLTEQHA